MREIDRRPIGFAYAFGASIALVITTGCARTPSSSNADNAAVYDAWRAGRTHIEVTLAGSVARIFGMRVGRSGTHEGFLVHLTGGDGRGLTVRVEDNVDLTGPIPLSEGESVEVRGEYIFASEGGIVHYTHRDRRGRHVAGYVLAGGKFYQ